MNFFSKRSKRVVSMSLPSPRGSCSEAGGRQRCRQSSSTCCALHTPWSGLLFAQPRLAKHLQAPKGGPISPGAMKARGEARGKGVPAAAASITVTASLPRKPRCFPGTGTARERPRSSASLRWAVRKALTGNAGRKEPEPLPPVAKPSRLLRDTGKTTQPRQARSSSGSNSARAGRPDGPHGAFFGERLAKSRLGKEWIRQPGTFLIVLNEAQLKAVNLQIL